MVLKSPCVANGWEKTLSQLSVKIYYMKLFTLNRKLCFLSGNHGNNGNNGATGQEGAKGEKGDKGDMGPRGERGHHGPKGEKGYPGIPPELQVQNLWHMLAAAVLRLWFSSLKNST